MAISCSHREGVVVAKKWLYRGVFVVLVSVIAVQQYCLNLYKDADIYFGAGQRSLVHMVASAENVFNPLIPDDVRTPESLASFINKNQKHCLKFESWCASVVTYKGERQVQFQNARYVFRGDKVLLHGDPELVSSEVREIMHKYDIQY